MSAYAPIGLTGGIASGKSTVAELLRGWGCFLADADEISRRALDPSTICYEQTVPLDGTSCARMGRWIERRWPGSSSRMRRPWRL